MHEGCVVSMKASEFIKDIDVDIYNFLNEELAQYEDLPEYFYGKDFMQDSNLRLQGRNLVRDLSSTPLC